MDKKKIIIKKYENRRLYDATHSRYVNLDEVARAVQDGYDVQVLDASTGEDLTRLVMTQIITENAKGPDSAFPLDILREMVVASGKASQESALNYMRVVADMYKDAFRPVPQHESLRNYAEYDESCLWLHRRSAKSASSSEEAKTSESKADTELQELKQRIQELEALVLKRGKAPSRQEEKSSQRSELLNFELVCSFP